MDLQRQGVTSIIFRNTGRNTANLVVDTATAAFASHGDRRIPKVTTNPGSFGIIDLFLGSGAEDQFKGEL
jgi:hypothetical protein